MLREKERRDVYGAGCASGCQEKMGVARNFRFARHPPTNTNNFILAENTNLGMAIRANLHDFISVAYRFISTRNVENRVRYCDRGH